MVIFNRKTTIGTLFLICLCSNSQAQDGAVWLDSIEIERRKRFGHGKKPQLKEVSKSATETIFDSWKETVTKPRFRFRADAAFTGRDIDHWSDGKPLKYEPFKALTKRFAQFPLPPIPALITTTNQVWQQNPPPNLIPLYTPILQFIANGPGPNGNGTIGNLITAQQLLPLTPHLLALIPILQSLQQQNLPLSNILNYPQAWQAIAVIQPILQPLGMWNLTTLNAWGTYLTPLSQQNLLTNILTTLNTQLLAALNLPPGSFIAVTNTFQPPPINVPEVIQELTQLWKSKNKKKIAVEFPRLINLLSKHLGFTFPEGVIYASRKGATKNNPWPYKVGLQMELRKGDSREIWVVNEEGFFINPYASGVGRYYQGSDDGSLVYLPFKVTSDGEIIIKDVLASHDYTLYKRMLGANTKLLNRAATNSTSLVNLDVAFLEDHLHLRISGGATPFATIGSIMGRIDYGDEDSIFYGHIGGGVGYKQSIFINNHDDYIGYLDTENYFRTPYLPILSEDKQRGLRFWGSLAVAVTGLAQRTVQRPLKKDKHIYPYWGIQAETRIIPELHGELATPYALFKVSGGVTTAIVPGGNIDLDNPERALSLYPIRTHIEASVRLRLGRVIDDWDQNSPISLNNSLFLEFGFVTEFSLSVDKTRIGVRLDWNSINIDFITEIEHWKDSSFTDIRVGGSFACHGFFATFLKSLKDDDYRLELGIDITSLWIDGELTRQRKSLLGSDFN